MITVEMFPAGNGDCILVSFDDHIILIDGGYTSTYRDHLEPRLKELDAQGKRLSKFIITHIDSDHITGAIEFIKKNGPADNPAVIGIDEVWYNSYRHLQFDDKEQGTFNGQLPDLKWKGGLESKEADTREQEVSQAQGTSLGSLLLKHKYAWNISFGEKAVKCDVPLKIKVGDKLDFTLIGPSSTSLKDLAEDWKVYLQKKFVGKLNNDAWFDDAFEMMMEEKRQAEMESKAEELEERLVAGSDDWVVDNSPEWKKQDTSVTNGSSIIFLAEYNAKTLLFLGDAIPGQVVEAIKKLEGWNGTSLNVDLVKVAHHGAWPNNSPALIDMLQADQYLISTNGYRHHHPGLSTLARIVATKRPGTKKNLVFNYAQGDRFSELKLQAMKDKYHYDLVWPDVDEWGNGKDGYVRVEL
jgi:beta-lactamase superfamily II metal-dependent hydrolase